MIPPHNMMPLIENITADHHSLYIPKECSGMIDLCVRACYTF